MANQMFTIDDPRDPKDTDTEWLNKCWALYAKMFPERIAALTDGVVKRVAHGG